MQQSIGRVMRQAWAKPEGKLTVIWALLCLPWLTGLKIIPFDAVQQFFPAVSFVAEQLRHLQAPWWNPYLYGGYPQLADPQMMSLQPSMVLPMLLAPTSLHLFTVVVLLHVLGSGLGTLRLARHYRLDALPQLLFALVMMFGAVAASRLQHTPMIISFAYLPWLWLALSRLRHAGRWGDAVLAGVVGGLCSLQLTQVTYFIILGCALYAGAALLLARGARMRLLLQLALVGLIAGLLSAPQWLSTLAWLPSTNRVQIGLDTALLGGIHLQTLATLLSGNVFEQGRGDYWGIGDITQDYLYLGAVPLALWLGWGGAVVRAQPVRARIALAVAVLATAFALGGRTPLFAWLFSWLPGLDLFRRPADALFVVVPMAAWLSAQALQQALSARAPRPHWASVGGLALLLACTLWWVLGASWHPKSLVWLVLSAVIGGFAVRSARRAGSGHGRAAGVLLSLIVVDLLVFNVGTAFNVSSGTRPNPTADRTGPIQSAYRALSTLRTDGIPERAAVFALPALTNGAAAYQLPLINGYNPLVASDYLQMTGIDWMPPARVQEMAPTTWAPDLAAPLFDLLGMRVLAAAYDFPGAERFEDEVNVARRESVLPRVLNPRNVRRHAERFPDPAAFASTDFTTTVWLSEGDHGACAERGAGQVQVRVTDYQASRLRLGYEADAAGWVVVNEATAPGWVATVNGTETPVLRANGLFRAVCVPAGAGELVLQYSPLALWKAGLAR